MILLFLGSWRSTLIVVISIPLSIVVSIIVLYFLDETLNVMTLGGMALAVGILVDDATVEIENIHRNLHQRKRLVQAILDGAQQIAVPAFVSTLCICIVFIPVAFISGPAKSLFVPLGMAVVFAMLTSYMLSRTLGPTMVHCLLESEVDLYGGVEQEGIEHQHGPRDKHVRFWRSLLWSLKAWVIVGAAGAVLFGVYWILPSGPKATLSASLPAVPALSAMQIVRIVLLALLLTAVAYYLFQNNWIWRTHEAFNRQF